MEAHLAERGARVTAMVQRLTLVFGGRQASPPERRFVAEEAGAGRWRVECLSDNDLIALVVEGSEQTLAELEGRYGRMAYGLALGVVRDEAIAEQVVDATIAAVWREGQTTSTPLQAGAAMLARVHYASVERSLAPAGIEPRRVPLEASTPSPSGGAWDLERESVHQALVQLPDEERELLVLAYYAGLSASELSDRVATSASTTTARMEVGLGRLTAALASVCEEDAASGSPPHSLLALVDPKGSGRDAPVPPVILVCDAEPVHRELVRASLECAPCDVFEVADHERLQPSIEALAPDLLILDPYPPGGDAIGEIMALRLHPNHARLPLLVLTAGVTRRQRETALAAGADCFLPKPFSPRELASTVAQCLEASSEAGEPAKTMEALG